VALSISNRDSNPHQTENSNNFKPINCTRSPF